MSTGIGAGISGVFSLNKGSSFKDLYSVSFDGVDQSLDLDSSPLLGTSGTGNWSVSLWVNLNALTGASNQRIFSFGVYGNIQTALQCNDSGVLFLSGPWTDQMSWGGTSGEWRHIVYRVDRTSTTDNVGFVVDGIIYDNKSEDTTGITFDTAGSGFFGRNAGSFNFAGLLSESAVWKKYLSDEDCIEIYNGGVPIDLSKSTPSDDLQNWWRMGDPLGQASYPTIIDLIGGNNASMTEMTSANITTNVPT